jgi:hypothetical protein
MPFQASLTFDSDARYTGDVSAVERKSKRSGTQEILEDHPNLQSER